MFTPGWLLCLHLEGSVASPLPVEFIPMYRAGTNTLVNISIQLAVNRHSIILAYSLSRASIGYTVHSSDSRNILAWKVLKMPAAVKRKDSSFQGNPVEWKVIPYFSWERDNRSGSLEPCIGLS